MQCERCKASIEAGEERGGLTLKDLERDFAVLRHMEKVRGEKHQDGIVLRLW